MKKNIIAVTLAGLALAGCSGQVSDAKTIVKQELIDPESAQFENVVVQKNELTTGGMVPVTIPATCGWVNSRNRMGGMVGAEPFMVRAGSRTFKNNSSWSEDFSNCIIYSDDKAATDRLMREGHRAMDAYADAVEGMNKAD